MVQDIIVSILALGAVIFVARRVIRNFKSTPSCPNCSVAEFKKRQQAKKKTEKK